MLKTYKTMELVEYCKCGPICREIWMLEEAALFWEKLFPCRICRGIWFFGKCAVVLESMRM